MTSPQIEQEIQAKGLTAPRITPADIEANIKGETYTRLPNGRTTLCQLTLRNGFTVEGLSACVEIANFNEELGNRIARADAVNKIWPLMGYELRSQLASKGSAK